MMKTIINYYLAKLPNRVFVDKKGCIYTSGGIFGYVNFIDFFIYGPSLHTECQEFLHPCIGASTVFISRIKEMEDFQYVGKL